MSDRSDPRALGAAVALAVAVQAVAVLAGCAPDEPFEAPEFPCTLAAEFQAELGHLDDPASIIDWQDFRNVVRMRDGRWIVRSIMVPQLFVYEPDGPFERTIGRAGEGPGEFNDPSTITVDRSDSIWVRDGGRIIVLDPEGAHARTMNAPGSEVDGFTPSNEPYALFVWAAPPDGDAVPYATVRSRDFEPVRELGPGLENRRADGRPIRMVGVGTVFESDSTVLTTAVRDRERSWIERWTPDGYEAWLYRADVWRAVGGEGAPPPRGEGSFVNLALTSDGDGGYWHVAAVRRPGLEEAEAGHYLSLEGGARTRAFASYLLHLAGDGTITGKVELPEAPQAFVDHEHLMSPRVYEETGLITMRVWRVSRECGR